MTETTRHDPDLILVRKAAAGDRGAFDSLVERHQGRIYNMARALTGDAAEAEDLAQETFVRAYRAVGQFRGDSAFKTWLFQIALNVVRSHVARKSRQAPVWGQMGSKDDVDPLAEVADTTQDVEDRFANRRLIDRALQTLPEEMRTIVTLRDIEGLDYREIASALNVPLGTVESRLFRARQRLRGVLGPLLTAAERPTRAQPVTVSGGTDD